MECNQNRVRYCVGCKHVRAGVMREDCPKCHSKRYMELKARLIRIPATSDFPFAHSQVAWDLVKRTRHARAHA